MTNNQALREQLQTILERDTLALICPCGGGGIDYDTEDREVCKRCNGTGLYEWRYETVIDSIIELFNTTHD